MAINLARGTVSPILPGVDYSNRRIDPNAYGVGLGQDLQQAGAELSRQAEFAARQTDEDNKRMQKFRTAKLYSEESLYAQQDLQKRVEEAPLGAPGFAPKVLEDYTARHKTILEGLKQEGYSQDVIDEMDLSLTGMRTGLQSKGYDFEQTSRVAKTRKDLDEVGLNLSQVASNNPAEMDGALETAYAAIDDLPGLDAPLRQKLKDEQRNIIVNAAGFGLADQEPGTVLRLLSGGTYNSGIGQPLVAQDLPPEAAQFLNVTASTESPDYNVINGGKRFASFSDHPREKGTGSTAAGRYQFVQDTWDRVAAANGFSDFSPENQDRGAWWLAQEDYRTNTGRDLLGDIRAGHYDVVRRGLGSTWEGLAKLSDEQFARKMTGEISGGNGGKLVDGKTGNPVLDALDASQRRAVFSAAQTKMNQQQAAYKGQFDQNVENATAAYLQTGTYAGDIPTQQEFYRAYPPGEAEQRWKAFEGVQQVGGFVQSMKTMSDSAIAAELAALAPKDTASPTYAQEVKSFEAAQGAAKNVIEQRKKDPAGYVTSNFPAAKQAWQAGMSGQGPMSGAYSQMQSGYEQLGTPIGDRVAWPNDIAEQQVQRYQRMTPEQKVGFVTTLRQDAGQLYPAALKQLSKNGLPAEAYISALVTLNPESQYVAANALRGLQAMEEDPTRKPNEEYAQQELSASLGSAAGYLDGDFTYGLYRTTLGLYVNNGGPKETDSRVFQQSLTEALGAPIYSSDSIPTLLPPGATEETYLGFKEKMTEEDLLRASRRRELPRYATGEMATPAQIEEDGNFVRVGPSSYAIIMESDNRPLVDATGQRYTLLLDAATMKAVSDRPDLDNVTVPFGANTGSTPGQVPPQTKSYTPFGANTGGTIGEDAGSTARPFPGAEKLTGVEKTFMNVIETAVYSGMMGTPSRLFVETVRGRRDDITEKDLSPEEQAGFKALVLKKANGKTSGRIDYPDYLGSGVDKNILGGFGYKIEGDKVIIDDIYDFKVPIDSGWDENPIIQSIAMGVKPENLANRIGGKLIPDTGRGIKVRVKL